MSIRLPVPNGDAGHWGTILNGFLGASFTPNGVPRSGEVYASRYGAVGDWNTTTNTGTDNTAALQAWVDDNATPGQILRLDRGIYGVSGQITVPSRCAIRGDESGGSMLIATAAMTNLLSLASTAAPVNQPANNGYFLSDLVLNGNNLATSCLDLQDNAGISSLFDRLKLQNATYAVSTPAGANGHEFCMRFRDCRVTGCASGIFLQGHLQGTLLDHCYITLPTVGGARAIFCNDQAGVNFGVTLLNCIIDGIANGAVGLDISNCGQVNVIGSYFEIDGQTTSRFIRISNALDGCQLNIDQSFFTAHNIGPLQAINISDSTQPCSISITNTIFDDVNVVSNKPTTLTYLADNNKYVNGSVPQLSHNRGVVTLPAGASTVSVAHGLYKTPTYTQMSPLGDINPASHFWVTKGVTNLTVTTNAAVTAATDFSWSADTNP